MTEPQRSALRVELQDPTGAWVPVGVLQWSNERTNFSSFDSYWKLAQRPVLGQVFEDRGPRWSPSTTLALPTWFSNLLPEGRLRQAVADAARVNEQREFLLLTRIGGDDLPGAVRVVPVEPSGELQETGPEDESRLVSGQQPPFLKFSLAGIQLKFSISDHDRGLTIPASGTSGTWIAKLPDSRPGYENIPEAEFAGLELARKSGIEVPETRLVDINEIDGLPDWATSGGGRAFVIRRFDRLDGRRVHAEELAQVLDLRPQRKYGRANFETVARVTSALAGASEVGAVIDRIVLNVLLGNGDAHVKNWAYVYKDGRSASLSPAYDIVPTVLFVPEDDLGLRLNGSLSFRDVTLASFERLAEKAGWDGTLGRNRAAEAVDRVLDAWPSLRDHLGNEQMSFLTRRRDSLQGLLP